ncbi:MATE family efflux transporter [Flavobacterium sinopsychrotolerans]|jgi:O-antigen/teichoic acid export membrane protein|uniref:Membrane protein involved in the export of O-antigen and teichoic acid n=1 Tax=Flavobacterium sinopsychrotolerans TaxID=604089 RepID=A0A1H8JNA8_9FLAO|nr:MATE family efflux transporter [Flavobacterium sinopsychrotolerans]SEN81827.1 Membrane protein involved in the export of O-antigen and teichoic acid [Flavobacterium sinopsychrotolerans]
MGFNKIKKNPFVLQSLKTMFLRIIGVVTLFGFSLFLTHNYDPKIIGQFDFIRIVLLVLSSICVLGTDQSILYFTGILKSKNEIQKLKMIYKKIVLLIFVLCLLVLLIFFGIGRNSINLFFNDKSTYVLMTKAIIALFFYSITLFNTETIRALDKIYIAELFRNTFKYVSVIFGAIVLFYYHQETYLVDTFLIGFVALSIITTIIIFRLFKKQKDDSILPSDTNPFSYSFIAHKSYPMAISNLAVFLMMTFDIVFLKKFKGDETVAYYAIAMKLVSILFMINNSVYISVSLKIAQLYTDNNKKELLKTLKQSARMIVFLTVPVVLFVCLFSENILYFFGENYTQSKQALLILMVGQLFASFFGVSAIYLNMTGRQSIFQIVLIFAVLVNLILNIILIPEYSMTGAAIAFVSSLLFWNIVTAIIVYKKDKLLILFH